MMQISQITSSGISPGTSGEMTASRPHVNEVVKTASAPVELPAKAVQGAKEAVDSERLKQAAEKINQTVRMFASNLQFTVDEDTKENVVKVVDTDTGEVIRQIPSEETLAIAKALDQLQGLIIRQKA